MIKDILEAAAIIQLIGEHKEKTMTSSEIVKGQKELLKEIDAICLDIKKANKDSGEQIKDDLKSLAKIGGYWNEST